jgi:diaminopropionate ammonia-lyase
VVVVPGTYDDAVTVSAGMAGERDLVVSDTSWPGYQDVPGWVIEGYSTIFAEIDAQLAVPDGDGVAEAGAADGEGDAGERRGDRIEVTNDGIAVRAAAVVDVAFVPLGVGALGAAAGACLRAGRNPGVGPLLVGVEPTTAACVSAAVEAGHLVEVPGPHRSIMAGLNCGEVSRVAWPVLRDGVRAAVAVSDDEVVAAMRTLHAAGLPTGESGASALAGARAAAGHPLLARDATVLLLLTEAVTDPEAYAALVATRRHS